MKLVLAYVWRTIRKNILTVLFEIIAISLAIGTLYLNITLSSDVVTSAEDDIINQTGGYRYSITYDDHHAINISELNLPKTSLMLPLSYHTYESGSMHSVQYYLEVFTDIYAIENQGLITLIQGNLPTGPNEAVISKTKANLNGLTVGNYIKYGGTGDETETTVRISGIVSDFTFVENDRPDLIEIMMQIEDDTPIHFLYVDFADNYDGIEYEIQQNNPGIEISSLLFAGNTSAIDNLTRILRLLFAVTFILAACVVYAVSTSQIQSRLSSYASFNSLGTRESVCRGLLFLENGVYALIAALFGITAGEIVRYCSLAFFFNQEDARIEFNFLAILISLLSSVVLSSAITFFTSRKISHLSIRDAFSSKPTSRRRISLPLTIVGFALVVSSILLRIFNIKYNVYVNEISLFFIVVGFILTLPFITYGCSKLLSALSKNSKSGVFFLTSRRFASSKFSVTSLRLITIAVAISIVCAFTINSINYFFEEYSKNFDFDVYIRGTDISDEDCEYVVTMTGVKSIKKEYWWRMITVCNGEATKICFVKQQGYINGITCYSLKDSELKSGQIIIDELFAKQKNLKTGDTVSILFAESTNIERSFTIAGFCDSGIYNTKRNTIILSDDDYFTCLRSTPERIDITLEEGYSPEMALSTLRLFSLINIDRQIEIGRNTIYLGREMSSTYQALKVFSVLPFFILLLSFIGVINNQIIDFKYRRREYAVLYSVSMNQSQLLRSIILESILVYIFGACIGAMLGTYCLFIIRDILYMLLAYVEIIPSIGNTLIIFLVGGILFVLASVFPARQLRNMNISKEIRNE